MMARLRAEIAILSAGIIVSAVPLFAGCADEADREPEPAAATRVATQAEEPRLPSKNEATTGREWQLQKWRDWWDHARELLFRDIQLSAEQASEIDAVIADQLDRGAELQMVEAELKAARKARNPERVDTARAAFSAARAQLKKPHEIYEDLRALLSEEQHPAFDMNRAHHVAESQAPAQEPAAQAETWTE